MRVVALAFGWGLVVWCWVVRRSFRWLVRVESQSRVECSRVQSSNEIVLERFVAVVDRVVLRN
jgi:hypothetical protein